MIASVCEASRSAKYKSSAYGKLKYDHNQRVKRWYHL